MDIPHKTIGFEASKQHQADVLKIIAHGRPTTSKWEIHALAVMFSLIYVHKVKVAGCTITQSWKIEKLFSNWKTKCNLN